MNDQIALIQSPISDFFPLDEPIQFSQGEVPLEKISNRPHGDTRRLNLSHIDELVESIAALGLIHPLVVDQQYHLLAGGHRRAALHKLCETEPALFSRIFPDHKIPVLICHIDAELDTKRAIAIEAAENEKRKDYTPQEVRALADKLIQAGYKSTRGKPARGTKALQPALAKIIGKSKRTVQRYLDQDNSDASPKPVQAKTSDLITPFDVIRSLALALYAFEELGEEDLEDLASTPELQRMARELRMRIESVK